MITPKEAKILIRILQESMTKDFQLLEDEENEVLREALEADAEACRKGIALISIIGE